MMYLSGFGRRVCFGLKTPQCAAIVFAAIAASGCSADVTRFDSSSFNLNDPPESAAPAPSEPVRSASDYSNPVAHSTPRGPYGAGAKTVEVAALPEPTPAPPVARPYTDQSWKRSPTAPAPAGQAYAPAAAAPVAAGSGETIDVQPGDTLYGISKRHHVSLAELMAANAMTSPNLKPGQKLIIPAAGGSHKSAAAPSAMAAAPAVAAAPVAPPVPMTPPSPELLAKYNSTYTVQPGDSVYKIARANRVNFSELQNVNGISDPRKVKPGTVLKVPAGAAPIAAAETLAQPVAPVAAPVAPRMSQNTNTVPTVINSGKQVAALNDKATDASPEVKAAPAVKADKVAAAAPQAAAQAVDSSKLRWPVSGRVIAGFGGRPDGTHNDGINMSVPLGTDVHAAESGVVAYSGSELKGYGNLVLLRHDNGWVTAYAHNDELLVKRGDKVKRGQVIGKAGKTGTVDQPQVHFELRQGSKPVDPTPFMEKM
ncbi:MAG: LysM peptidoglycan-binding domain-containing protein [Hyphomicrobium sp.]|nr:LysM peptidoglycan-binding domain-containing protein [Hyphomicrobium sp.]